MVLRLSGVFMVCTLSAFTVILLVKFICGSFELSFIVPQSEIIDGEGRKEGKRV